MYNLFNVEYTYIFMYYGYNSLLCHVTKCYKLKVIEGISNTTLIKRLTHYFFKKNNSCIRVVIEPR